MLIYCISLVHSQVEFSSLDFLLHTKALLSTINYMNSALPQEITASKERETKRQTERAAAGKTGKHTHIHAYVFYVV